MEKRDIDTPMMSTLLQLPLFQGLTVNQLMDILEKVRPDFFTVTDGYVARQRDKHDQMLFLLKGRLWREYRDPSGRFTFTESLDSTRLLEAGSMFGRMAEYEASYRADGRASLLAFNKKYMFSVFNRFDIVQLNMLNLLSAHAQAIQDKLRDTLGGDDVTCFRTFINNLSEVHTGAKRLEATRHELAMMFGCSQRRLSDHIVAWAKAGLLDAAYSCITIHDLTQFNAATLAQRM